MLRPRMWRICLVVEVVDALAFQQDLPAGDAARRLQQADDGRAGERLARAGLADHAQDLAGRDVEGDVVERAQRAAAAGKFDDEVLDLRAEAHGSDAQSAQARVERIAQPVAQQVHAQRDQHQHQRRGTR